MELLDEIVERVEDFMKYVTNSERIFWVIFSMVSFGIGLLIGFAMWKAGR
ncbi:MAG: hypothetical protein WC974_04120 [Thermoplasmata archaeon]